MAEETVILHFEVDQSKAERQLEKIEGLLLDNKKAQQDLTKAYKDGNITQEEYVKENIRLQANIKKEQDQKRALIRTMETESNSRNAIKQRVSQLAKEYDNLNLKTAQGAKRADELEKELAQLNSQLTKGDKAAGLFKNQIGNYPAQFAEAAKGINVAGVSVGGLTSQFASLANPATAAVGIVTALGAAYAKSTLGAKDLSFAQNQLAIATTLVTNQLASLITSAEDGQGAVTSLLNDALNFFDSAPAFLIPRSLLKQAGVDLGDIADKSKELALAQEKLEDLGRLEVEIRTNANQRLEENQELMEQISDEQVSINDRLKAADQVEESLVINKHNILSVLNDEYKVIQDIAAANVEDEDLQNKVLEKRRQISSEASALERQITKINKLQDDLNAKLGKELELRKQKAKAEQELFEFEVREANAPDISLANETGAASRQGIDPIIESSKARQEQYIKELDTNEIVERQKRASWAESALLHEELSKQEADGIYAISTSLANGLSKLAKEGSDEQIALALTGIAIDTASAIAGGVAASQDIPYPGNLAAMASTIAAVLGAIAEATAIVNSAGFAEGGWTGPGAKHDVAGVVHADEYVVPKHINNSPAAQPHLAALERMRGGYADGGFVVNQSTSSSQQALIMANAMKNLPVPILSVQEVTRVQNRIAVKEKLSTLNP